MKDLKILKNFQNLSINLYINNKKYIIKSKHKIRYNKLRNNKSKKKFNSKNILVQRKLYNNKIVKNK